MAKLKRKIAESRILSLAKQVFIRINIEDIFVISSLVISYLKNKFDKAFGFLKKLTMISVLDSTLTFPTLDLICYSISLEAS